MNSRIKFPEIDKDVPIPPKKSDFVSPLSKMVVGDSMLFLDANVSRATVYQATRVFMRKNAGTSFVSRKEGDGFRVWRVT